MMLRKVSPLYWEQMFTWLSRRSSRHTSEPITHMKRLHKEKDLFLLSVSV